jgi:hypothetical protein
MSPLVRINKVHEQIGPRTLVQQLPASVIHRPVAPNKNTDTKSTTLNSSPRAGQSWRLESIYFEFPLAEKSAIIFGGATQAGEFEFSVKLIIGGVISAKQTFIAKAEKVLEEPGEKWAIVGNLEAFSNHVVYAGQDITIETELSFPAQAQAFGEANTQIGKAIVVYSIFT